MSEESNPQESECLQNPPYMTISEAHRAIKGDLDLLGCIDIDDLREQQTDPDNSYSRT